MSAGKSCAKRNYSSSRQVSQSSLLPASMTLGSLPVTSSSPVPTSAPEAASKEDDEGLRMSLSSTSSDRMAFLLLSQEEYLEHNSKVTHCQFSSSGAVIASSDLDGVLKVGKLNPLKNPSLFANLLVSDLVSDSQSPNQSDVHSQDPHHSFRVGARIRPSFPLRHKRWHREDLRPDRETNFERGQLWV